MRDLDLYISQGIDQLDWPMVGFVRIMIALVCGGLVGLEREVRGRQAGFRTNALVCVGCAIAMLVSLRIAHVNWAVNAELLRIDPARIAYGVMAGIGFLGGGVIVRHGTTVRGLTTAAAIWCVAAIGLAAGMGLYLFAAIGAVISFATLWILDYLEILLPRTHYRAVTVRRRWSEHCVSKTVQALKDAGYKVGDWSFEREGSEYQDVRITMHVGFNDKREFDALERDLPKHHELELISVREG